MCRAVNCRTCGKTTWSGCGSHVSQVMAGVPRDQRCTGHAAPSRDDGEGFFARFFGRD
jgi:hypothetical protein